MSFLMSQKIKEELNNNDDVITRQLSTESGIVSLIFLKSMTDKQQIPYEIITPILEYKTLFDFNVLKSSIIRSTEVEEIEEEKVIDNILQNKIIVEFDQQYLAIDLESYPTRQPTEPPTSANIFGPREGFTEAIKINISLIRKRMPTKNLVIENLLVGTETKTKVNIVYLKNVADKEVVERITKKINSICIDGIIDTYYIAEFLRERPNSMFAQAGIQEKPDVVAGKVLEGRVAVFVDGSPVVLTLPYIVFEDIQSSNDYYSSYVYANFVRIIRLFGILISTIIPGLYLSIRLYSYKTIPMNFIITISNSTKNLPFTPFLEMAFILLLFQILYEVSLRLPQYLGLATSIVGALVLGDTGVKAGLISPPGVIVVAISIMSIYTVPNQANQLTIIRAIFLILGSTVGIFGIIGGVLYFLTYFNTLNYYGAPYLAPYSPRIGKDLKDGIFKRPLDEMYTRPHSFPETNKRRLKNDR